MKSKDNKIWRGLRRLGTCIIKKDFIIIGVNIEVSWKPTSSMFSINDFGISCLFYISDSNATILSKDKLWYSLNVYMIKITYRIRIASR